MKSSYVLIKPHGEEAAVPCDKVSLELAQSLVGGYVQVVPLFRKYLGKSCVVLCDEDGKMKGQPLNSRATLEWTNNTPGRGDYLVGNVLIIMGPAARAWA